MDVYPPMQEKLLRLIKSRRQSQQAYPYQAFDSTYNQRLDAAVAIALVLPSPPDVVALLPHSSLHVRVNSA
eukprot:5640969-Amphidinium_carterae.1